MVDYQTAVAAVQDPQADPILLAKIAYRTRSSAPTWRCIHAPTPD